MEWACKKKNLVIDFLKVCQWKSTKLLYASHTKMMNEDPENCTIWKHKWLLAQSSERVGHDGYTQVQIHHLHFDKNETPHGTQTRTWRSRHPEIWVLETALFTCVKTRLQCKCVESLMWLANGSMENLPKEQSTRTPMGNQKNLALMVEEKNCHADLYHRRLREANLKGTRPRSKPLGRHWRTGMRGNWYL